MTKLTEAQLNDVMVESLVLSVALIERFDIMEENKLVAHRAKQSVKTASNFLQTYVDKVFDSSKEDDNYKKHMNKGASHLTELTNRLEQGLKYSSLMDISQRKEKLWGLIEETVLFEPQKQELYEKIRDSGILDY